MMASRTHFRSNWILASRNSQRNSSNCPRAFTVRQPLRCTSIPNSYTVVVSRASHSLSQSKYPTQPKIGLEWATRSKSIFGRDRSIRLRSGFGARCGRDGADDVKLKQVRHRSHATFSRQPRQVRKEATVTGSCVCSEVPVSDFNFFPTPCWFGLWPSDYRNLHPLYDSLRKKQLSRHP